MDPNIIEEILKLCQDIRNKCDIVEQLILELINTEDDEDSKQYLDDIHVKIFNAHC